MSDFHGFINFCEVLMVPETKSQQIFIFIWRWEYGVWAISWEKESNPTAAFSEIVGDGIERQSKYSNKNIKTLFLKYIFKK